MLYQFLAVFVTLLAAASAVTDVEWTVFKAKHTKVYDKEQDYFRRMIYEENMMKIQEHNVLFAKGVKSFFMKENEYTDKTHTEFVKAMNGYKAPANKNKSFRKFNNMTSLPESVDWVKAGYVAEVKNQGECGSCWSFSATGAMEGANKKATGHLVSLSEQNLIDCSWDYGNQGCNGGIVDDAFLYVVNNGGVDTEASYPYTESDYGDCNYNPDNVGAKISSFKDVKQDSEAALKETTANVGPVSVAIDASHDSLQNYGGGVYDEAACTTNVDHAVLVVGYGTEDGKDYWLVKNSWGASWGLKGYVKMSRNKNNQCGIASQACYPIA